MVFEIKSRVLLLADEPGISFQVLLCLEAMGAEIHVMANPRAAHLRWARSCASFRALAMDPAGDAAALAAAIDSRARQVNAELILPSDPASTRFLVGLRAHLETPCFPLPEQALFDRMDDKWPFSRMLSEFNLPGPKTIYIGDKSHLDLALLEAELGFPMVVKPSNQGNSNGVVIARNRDDIQRQIVDNARYPYTSLIAQEFIPGIDIDLSFLAIDGRMQAWTVQLRRAKTIVFRPQENYVEIGRRIVEATGYHGVAHIDGRLDSRDGTLKLIECNPRFWGSITASLHCGINFVAEGIAAANGTVDSESRQSIESGFFIPPTALMVNIIRSPWKRELWTRPNLAGLKQAMGNLRSYCWEEWHARKRQIIERRRLRN